jgi:imidazolonepropionase-like amidohydrolase
MRIYSLLFIVFSLGYSYSQKTLLKGAKIHIGNGNVIEEGYLGIENDKIILVKNMLVSSIIDSEWDSIIDVSGSQIYPGFVASNTTLGLTEIDAVRATRDYDEVGEFNPHIRSQIAFNAESKVAQTVRTNGVLITQATPRGGIISGTSSVMSLFGWNWEDATILKDDGIHVNWPRSTQGGGWWAEPKPKTRNKNYQTEKSKLSEFFSLAKGYSEAKTPSFDQRLESMRRCFSGNQRVYFHANELQQIHDIIDLVNKFEIKHPVLVGGYDAHIVGRKLLDSKMPVMLKRIHSLPQIEDEPTDLPYKSAFLLQEQGIQFCIQGAGDMEAMNSRNLPFLAGTAMAYGLSEEEAVRAISLSPCEIMGLNQDYGSLEVGKKATFFVSAGNALDMIGNDVLLIFFDGQSKSTSNFQKELYLRYKQKYEGE